MKTGGGGCDRSTWLGIDSLIALTVTGRIRARDVRRERDVADAIEGGEEILDALKDGLKADAAFAEFRAGEDLGLQIVEIALAEKETLTDADLAPGTDQTFPVVGVGGELAGQ